MTVLLALRLSHEEAKMTIVRLLQCRQRLVGSCEVILDGFGLGLMDCEVVFWFFWVLVVGRTCKDLEDL